MVKTNADGIPVLIRNVAVVRFGSAVRYGAMTRNNEGEVVGAVVMMLKGANAAKVVHNVKKRMAQIEKTLPEGVVIEPFLDRTKLVDNAIGTVAKNLVEGALIVIFVLVLLLGNFRAGLIVASVIPLAMLFAVSLMNLFGVSGNLMSLGAIDFGLIVDGAVIIVEATLHHLGMRKSRERLTQAEMDAEVYESASKIRNSAAFGEIIILIVYLPILALVGIEGKMFRPMAQTVSFAILGAFILSLTYVPMVSALFLGKKTSRKKNISDRIMSFFQRVYTPMLRFALRAKVAVVGIAVGLFAVSLLLFRFMGAEFIPTLDEGDFAVEVRVLTGSSLSQTVEASLRTAKVLQEYFPEVEEVVGKIGSGEIPTDPMPVEACDLIVILKDKKHWTGASSREELAKKMQDKLEQHIPGVTFGFQQPIQMRFNELMSGARQDVVVKIYGEDLDLLAGYAKQIGAIAQGIEGAQDVYVEQVSGLPQIVVKYQRDKIAQFGLNVEDINTVIRTGFAGASAGLVFEGEKRFDLVVRLDKQNRQSPDDIRNLFVTAPNGNQVPIEQLAEIGFREVPNKIQRDDAKRRIIVGFNVRGRDVESIVAEMRQKVDAQVLFEPGYYPTYGGTFENLQAAKARLGIAVPVALLLIFFLLYVTFSSVKQSLLIFTAIPLSAIGGVFALWIRGMPFSISAGVGFIALFGVAVLNGIVLIAEFNRLKNENRHGLEDIVTEGTRLRLRPVLMTAAVASLGFLPMALSNGAGAGVQRPLATVVIGGLATSTLLTLLVLPVLYVTAERFSFRKPRGAAVAGLLALSMVPGLLQAQQARTVGLREALDSAAANNLAIQAERHMADGRQVLVHTGWDIPKTDIGLQYGQYNSRAPDYQLGLTQTLQFPTVYAAQTGWLKNEAKAAAVSVESRQNELRKRVRQVFYEWQILWRRENLLRRADSLYGIFAQKAEQRAALGETGRLERNAAVNQSAQVRQQLAALQTEKDNLAALLGQLMNTASPVRPDTAAAEMPVPDIAGAGFPAIAYREQTVQSMVSRQRLEKARLYPDLLFGYYNTGLTGIQNIGGVDVYYGPDRRFSYFTAGIGIPLFFGAQAARIKAAGLAVEQSRKELSAAEQEWKTARANTQSTIRTQQRILAEYRNTILPNAIQNMRLADEQLNGGAIGFLEWTVLVDRSIQSQNEYLNQVRSYNLAVIENLYLNGF